MKKLRHREGGREDTRGCAVNSGRDGPRLTFQGSSHLPRPPSEEKGFPRAEWESDFGGRPWAQEGGVGVLGWVVQGRDRALRGQWARANLSRRDHGCPGTGGHGHHLGLGVRLLRNIPPSSRYPHQLPCPGIFSALFFCPLLPSFSSPSTPFSLFQSLLPLCWSLLGCWSLYYLCPSLRSISRCLSLPSGSLSLSHHLTLSPAVTSTSVGPRLL